MYLGLIELLSSICYQKASISLTGFKVHLFNEAKFDLQCHAMSQ